MQLIFIACFLSILAIVIRGTLPRYRIDQALTLHWKLIAIYLLLFYLAIVLASYILIL